MRSPAKHALFGCMFVYQSLSNLLGGNSKVKNSFLSIQIQTRCEYSAANNYFFLEGRMSDQVTILIGHSRKLVGHHLSAGILASQTSFLVGNSLSFDTKKALLT